MKDYMEQIKQASLFEGIEQQDLERLLHCLNAFPKAFQKGDILQQSEAAVEQFFVLLAGKVNLLWPDKLGAEGIVEEIDPSATFLALSACTQSQKSPVTAVAQEDCILLPLTAQKVITACSLCCSCHTRLTFNLIKQLACKGLAFRYKTEVLSQRSLRDKIMVYLFIEGKGASAFSIPHNRSQLAEYLCVDRSALSRELCRMREAGLLTFQKNRFTLPPVATGRLISANLPTTDGQVAAPDGCYARLGRDL